MFCIIYLYTRDERQLMPQILLYRPTYPSYFLNYTIGTPHVYYYKSSYISAFWSTDLEPLMENTVQERYGHDN